MAIVTLEIVLELVKRLATIQIADGYWTNAGLCIYRGRTQFDARIDPVTGKPRDQFPLISLKMAALTPRDPDYRSRPRPDTKRAYMAAVEINAADVFAGDHPQDRAHQLLADIWRALNLDRPVYGTRPIVPGEVRIGDPDPVDAVIVVTQTVTVEFPLLFGGEQ